MFIFDIFDSVSGKICKLRSLELEKKGKSIDSIDKVCEAFLFICSKIPSYLIVTNSANKRVVF